MCLLVLNPTLYHLSPFIWSYVAVSKPCCLLKFYPNMASVLDTNMKINTNNTWLSQQYSVPDTNCFWLQKKLTSDKVIKT